MLAIPKIIALTALCGLAPAQQLLVDLNTAPVTSRSSTPRSLITVGGLTYFVARRDTAPATGVELYATTGQPGSLRLVGDLHPGSSDANPSGFLAHNGSLYFGADINAIGDRGFFRLDPVNSTLDRLFTVGSTLISDAKGFAVANGSIFIDGESLGRRYLYQMTGPNPGPQLSLLAPKVGVAAVGGLLVFTPAEEPWISGGTPATTTRLLDIHPTGDSCPREFTQVGGVVYFSATDPIAGRELWQTDGTVAGTQRVHDIAPGTQSSEPRDLFAFQGQLLFTAEDGTAGRELWAASGGSAARLRDIAPGSGASNPAGFEIFGAHAFFSATDGAGDRELWRTDGTPSGTARFADLALAASSEPDHLTSAGGKLYFGVRRQGASGGASLMVSDGTVPGTLRASSVGLLVGEMVAAGGANADVVLLTSSSRIGEIWSSSGTPATTVFVGNPNQANGSSNPGTITSLGGRGVFYATSPVAGVELFETDGTASGTRMVADLNPGPANSNPFGFFAFGKRVLFTADSGQGRELHWYEPGKPVETVDLYPVGSSSPSQFVELRGVCYFLATDGAGKGPFRTDGTASGTRRVSAATRFVELRRAGKNLFLHDFNRNLWVSDGTTTGTRAVPSSVRASFSAAVPWRNQLLFVGTSSNTVDPWITDGTAAGTRRLIDIPAPRPTISGFATHQGQIYFLADGRLYVSNSTTAGTSVVTISPIAIQPQVLRATVNGLILAGSTGVHEKAVIRCDHDGRNARVLGSHGSSTTHSAVEILGLKVHGDAEYVTYSVRERRLGQSPTTYSLWRSVSALPATRLDPLPNFAAQSTSSAAVVGDKLLFTLDHLVHGGEIFTASEVGVAEPLSAGCASSGLPPRLRTDRWALNRVPTALADRAPVLATGALVLGAPTALPVDLGQGCRLHVNLQLPTTIRLQPTDPIGNASWQFPRIPNSPSLLGATLGIQAGFGPTPTGPLGLDLSNGLRFVIGR